MQGKGRIGKPCIPGEDIDFMPFLIYTRESEKLHKSRECYSQHNASFPPLNADEAVSSIDDAGVLDQVSINSYAFFILISVSFGAVR
jgi:hypothetical protein